MKKGILMLTFIILLSGCGIEKKEVMEDLTKKTLSEVETYAKEKELSLEVKEVYSNDPKDQILSQSIKKGTEIEKDQTLTVEISMGRLEDKTYEEYKVNELGRVPIMMYHGIHNKEAKYTGGNIDKDGYQRTAEAFRKDLEMYYEKGYEMIPLKDYVNGIIDVSLGKSPLILTFDDGLENNIKVTGVDEEGNIQIDPNSAVGILEEFKQKHKDAKVTATFFVNGGLFNQKEYNEKILNWLVDHGYDVGNHSYTHPDFKTISEEKAIQEIGSVYALLEQTIPGKYVSIVALPFGSPYVKTHKNFNHIIEGTYEGKNYQTISTLRVGWESEVSPFDTTFDPLFLKRIRAYDNNGKDFDITYNFNYLEKTKYISDGNKDNVVVPKGKESQINTKNLQLITY